MIKTGAPARTDRTAKYNQLLRIEEQLGATRPTSVGRRSRAEPTREHPMADRPKTDRSKPPDSKAASPRFPPRHARRPAAPPASPTGRAGAAP